MKTLPLLALSLALVSAGLSTARAETIHGGNYTAEITKTGAMAAYATLGVPNSITFGHERLNGSTEWNSVVQVAGTMTATFQSAPGLIFDKFYFAGIGGGATYNEETGVYADFNWTVNGGTLIAGSPTYGGFDSTTATPFSPNRREWELTGPQTGRSSAYAGNWYQTQFYGSIFSSAAYAIGASSFSIDWSALVTVSRYQGQWPGAIDPQAHGFIFSYLPAPPPTSPVPETGATAGLMLLALAGMAGVRRLATAQQAAA